MSVMCVHFVHQLVQRIHTPSKVRHTKFVIRRMGHKEEIRCTCFYYFLHGHADRSALHKRRPEPEMRKSVHKVASSLRFSTWEASYCLDSFRFLVLYNNTMSTDRANMENCLFLYFLLVNIAIIT